MINSIKRHRYSNRNICKHIIMEMLSLITCLLHFICWLCHIREGSAMAWRRRERENKIERESGHYPWGGRQFSYSDWLIAQSCHEQEGTGHQESEEKWLWLWVRRKEGQLLFISIERTTYVVWENRFGAESALVRKTASLFSSFCLFSSCQTWWKVCAIFAETLRQVSYYTTMELKNKTKKTIETQFPNFAPIHQFTVFVHIPLYVYVGYFANSKVHGYFIILNDSCQNSGCLSILCLRGTANRRRERLSKGFWSAANAISWCHVLSALLFTSPL